MSARLFIYVSRFFFALALALAARGAAVAQRVAHEDANRKFAGIAVIDHVITTGSEPVFQADGYTLRVNSGTNVRSAISQASVNEVKTNAWVRYEGRRNDAGEIALSTLEFIQPKLRSPKRDPRVSVAQVTTFPHGSMIDFDGNFTTERFKHKIEDSGGACGTGWYPVAENPALQDRVRRLGARVVPQYQRDLPEDDPAKIPFRFYAIEDDYLRSDLGCEGGLVLVPAKVVDRTENDNQLAALLADGVAASLQRQNVRVQSEMNWIAASEVAAIIGGGVTGWTAESIAVRPILRKFEEQRERVALALMFDAGFDPWQAPEAWRLLAPRQLPKNLSKLKYPARSEYQLEILRLQYKPMTDSTSTQAADPPAPAR